MRIVASMRQSGVGRPFRSIVGYTIPLRGGFGVPAERARQAVEQDGAQRAGLQRDSTQICHACERYRAGGIEYCTAALLDALPSFLSFITTSCLIPATS